MSHRITHFATAPDGRGVTITCQADRLQADWFWHMRLTSKTVAIGVSISADGYFAYTVARDKLTVRQRVTYRGREFALGVSSQNWMAAWQGPHNTLAFAGPAPAPDLGSLVAVLDGLSISDTAIGLTARPVPGNGVVTWGLFGVKFADAGMITIMPKEDAPSLVPASPGLKVDAGTVWSKSLETDSSSRARKFVHVGDTAVCTIDDDLGRDPAVTEAGQAALIESLNVQWSRVRRR